jgi:hypothetical protein
MRPSALVITMKRYWGITKRLRAARDAAAGVDVRVETPRYFDEIRTC